MKYMFEAERLFSRANVHNLDDRAALKGKRARALLRREELYCFSSLFLDDFSPTNTPLLSPPRIGTLGSGVRHLALFRKVELLQVGGSR